MPKLAFADQGGAPRCAAIVILAVTDDDLQALLAKCGIGLDMMPSGYLQVA